MPYPDGHQLTPAVIVTIEEDQSIRSGTTLPPVTLLAFHQYFNRFTEKSSSNPGGDALLKALYLVHPAFLLRCGHIIDEFAGGRRPRPGRIGRYVYGIELKVG
jgi:hypothetical protein